MARIDRLAALMRAPSVTLARLQAEYAGPALRVPEVVATYSPPDHQRAEVTLRR